MEAHPPKIRRWLKPCLSALIIYHLFCVIVAPHSANYIGVKSSPVVKPYLFLFELTNEWSFFAPDPGPSVFIDYELIDADGKSFKLGRWPEMDQSFFLRERLNRRVSAAVFMTAFENRAEKMMVPFLCSREPKAHSLRLWRVMHSTPMMADVESGKRKIGDDVGVEKKFVSHNFCASSPSPKPKEAGHGNS